MASATGIPERNPAAEGRGEDEPLLGRVGDASQQDGKPLLYNLILGTAIIAQAGVWILAAVIWGSILSQKLILFSAHPLLNSAGLLVLAQGALILQPTHTADQKRQGTYAHAAFNSLALGLFIAGLIVIEVNKERGGTAHFESPHAILGLITYVLILGQAFVGATQYFVPQLYGGVDNAKKIYKYHRMAGYAIAVLILVTIAAATQTTFNKKVIHIQLWAVIVCEVIFLAGVLPRIKKQKPGL